MTPVAGAHRHLYRPSSLPVNLQHSDLPAASLASPQLAASATDDEERGMAMTSLRRGSDIKMTSSIIQAAVPSAVCSLLSIQIIAFFTPYIQ